MEQICSRAATTGPACRPSRKGWRRRLYVPFALLHFRLFHALHLQRLPWARPRHRLLRDRTRPSLSPALFSVQIQVSIDRSRHGVMTTILAGVWHGRSAGSVAMKSDVRRGSSAVQHCPPQLCLACHQQQPKGGILWHRYPQIPETCYWRPCGQGADTVHAGSQCRKDTCEALKRLETEVQ